MEYEAGYADDLVHFHRHGPHAPGNRDGQAPTGLLPGQLRIDERLVLGDVHDQATAHDLARLGGEPFGHG